MGERLALVVATGTYDDAGLARLRSPVHDAAGFAEVLGDPEIGGFAVTSVVDQPHHKVRLAIQDLLTDRRAEDLVLLYLSCHGVRDARGRLFFAATDTRKERLAATGVESAWVLEQLDDCRAARQIVVLDCCFSGSFAHRAKGDEQLLGAGRGRVVLTASRAGEYSFEGRPLPGAAVALSAFTSGLVDGLRTGAADLDGDGRITVDEAYEYAFAFVRRSGVAQTPQRSIHAGEGQIVLARNRHAEHRPVDLPEPRHRTRPVFGHDVEPAFTYAATGTGGLVATIGLVVGNTVGATVGAVLLTLASVVQLWCTAGLRPRPVRAVATAALAGGSAPATMAGPIIGRWDWAVIGVLMVCGAGLVHWWHERHRGP